MNSAADPLVTCPSCRTTVLTSGCKKIASRSGGKTSMSLRCFACIKRKEQAIKDAQVRAKNLR